MKDPKVAAKEPVAVELETGRPYSWCTCGLSARQPFCDASHRGTDFASLKFTVEEPKTAYLCQCKQTKNPPYCDGSHNQL